MAFLVFQLRAPLAAWGDTAVGEYRGSQDYPGESAIVGLLGAALGLRRTDDAAHAALVRGYGVAIGVQASGSLLRDYHTAQVPGRTSLKRRPHATRRDELQVPKHDLNTVLSTRDYRQNVAYLIALQAKENSPFALEVLAEALRKPHFVLYLGRKSCPPSSPLFPQIMDARSAREAFENYLERLSHLYSFHAKPVVRISWADGIEAGVPSDISVPRKDRLLRRSAWQFGDRLEYIWFEGAV